MRYIFSLLLISFSLFAKTVFYPPQIAEDPWIKERKFFEENGFIWIKDFFSDEQAELIQKWAEEIDHASQTLLQLQETTGRELSDLIQNIPGAPIVVQERSDPKKVCRAEDFYDCVPALYDFIKASVTSYVGSFLNEPYVLFKDKINFKWPGGGAFLPHQDFPAYEFLGPREHITAMITVDRATEENGCLKVAVDWQQAFLDDPELDQKALREARAVFPYIVGGKEHGAIEPRFTSRMKWLSLLTSPKDLVLFTSYLPHYSEVNKSQGSRRAMFFTLNKLSEGDHRGAYYHAKRNDPHNPIFHIGTPTKATNK